MFAKNVVGTASSIMGTSVEIGVTQLFMGSLVFPTFRHFFRGDSEMAWRASMAVPSTIALITSVLVYCISDDTPQGNFIDLKKSGKLRHVSASSSFRKGAMNTNAWCLLAQYACIVGVELTTNNAAAFYFKDQFGQSTESAAAIASLYGWVAPIGTVIGGFLSDFMALSHLQFRGRLMVQMISCVLMGVMILIFSKMQTLSGSILLYIFISISQKAAASSLFALVPYIEPSSTGSIAGLVSSGAGVGGVIFGIGFRQLSYDLPFAPCRTLP